MELLKEIANFSGKSGLYRILKPGRGGVIVESLDAKREKSIIVKVACRATSGGFPVMGIIEIVCPEKPKSIVDYGDGSCDRTYTVTTNGVTETKIRK